MASNRSKVKAARTPKLRGAANKDEAQDSGVKTLRLGLQILEFLVHAGNDVGVTEIAAHFGTTKARAFRLLQTLVDRGYVVQDAATSRYAPSVRLFALGQSVGDRFDLAAVLKPEAQFLWEKLGHTVVTAILFKGRMLILDVLRGRTPISIGLKVSATLDLHSSAQGRLALAFGGGDLLENVLRQPLAAHTPQTLVSASALRAEIRRIRMNGWASAPDQLVVGMNAIASPVFQHDGSLAGTLAVCGLTQFVPEPPTPELIDDLTAATWRVSRKLGWSGKIVPARGG
ncbi:MAG: IclR family transcriptional regulator [Variibacter sp.]